MLSNIWRVSRVRRVRVRVHVLFAGVHAEPSRARAYPIRLSTLKKRI